ncbi:MAG TPA: TfuA-like protein [Kofleriaceae bacterium]|nr:TfuA-like protein [Kofleriaceae bacterium]
MREDVVVFLGPSLEVERARAVLDARYLPPARMGDVYDAVVRGGARAVAIIDGLFDRVPSVWHKEILFALSRGVRVFGGSSMGALRAAELAAYGMEGVGAVFEAFASGALEDDDEVAVTHGAAEHGFVQTSEAMVNLRHGLGLAVAAGALAADAAARLEEAARRRFYPDRSWPQLLADGRAMGIEPEQIDGLARFLAQERPNLKRDDALAVLAALAGELERGLAPHAPTFDFEPTVFWEKLVATMTRPGGGGARQEEVRAAVQLSPGRDELVRGALLLHLVEGEARRLGLAVGDPEVAAAAERFRRARGLESSADAAAYLARNGLGRAELRRLARLEALVEALCRYHAGAVDAELVTELQRVDRHGAVVAELARREQVLAAAGVTRPTVEDTGLELRDLVDWYQRTVRRIDEDITAHAHRLRFHDAKELLCQLAALYLVQTGEAAGP